MPHQDEEARLQALRELGLLDTDPTEAFDRITRMAAQVFNLPIAAISLTDLDRQWFKSRVGIDHVSIPRDRAPCAEVAENCSELVITDLLAHPRYRDSVLARKGVRFYAGAPLVTRDGYGLGSMCVLGSNPRQVSSQEIAALSDLASMAMEQIELKHAFRRVDPLSGMPNRNQFLEDLEDLNHDMPDQKRHVVLVDLASLQQLSDATRVMGASYFDEMIKEAALALSSGSGADRKTYHIASTQFAFLAPPAIVEADYALMLTRKLEQVRESPLYRFVTTTVIGIAPFVVGTLSPENVLRIAQSAAQDVRIGEGRVGIYSSNQDAAQQRRFTLMNDFGTALETSDQLSLVYQPRIDVKSGACIGAEALLRWCHPTLGAVSPGEFIPILEKTSLTRATTAWVVNASLKQLAIWHEAGIEIPLSVNISAANLSEVDFVERIVAELASFNLPASCLELEITESAIMVNADRALATLEAVGSAGVQLAIDDFGTGYSSLSYMQRLPVHVVKIDQSFVKNVADDKRKQSLVSTMIRLTQDLGYRVVAEGVEDQRTLDFVAQCGCDEVQGYLFSRPLVADDFVKWFVKSVESSDDDVDIKLIFPVHKGLALDRPAQVSGLTGVDADKVELQTPGVIQVFDV